METTNSTTSPRHIFLLLCTFMVLGGLLRLAFLSDKSVVGDESCTLNLIHLSWSQLFKNQYPGEFNPALYFLTLKAWASLFGFHEFSVRLLSATFSVLALPFIYLAGKLISSEKVGLLAAWLYIFSPLSIQYAQISRAYSLLLLWTACSLFIYIKFLKSPNPSLKILILLTLCNLLGTYTHYFFALFWIMEALSLLVFSFFRQWTRHAKYFILASFLGFLMYLPQFFILLHQIAEVSKIQQKQALLGFVLKFCLMIYGLFLGESLSPLNVMYVGIAFITLLGLAYVGFRHILKKRDPFIFILLLLSFVPLFIISLTGIARPMYAIFTLPTLLILLSVFIFQVKKKPLRIIFVLILTLITLRSDAYWYQKAPGQILNSGLLIPMREVVETLKTEAQPKDTVLLFPEWLHYSFDYYFTPSTKTNSSFSISRKNFRNDFESILPHLEGRLWLIAEYDDDNQREELKKFLGEKGWKVTHYQGLIPNEHLIKQIQGKPSETYYSLEVLLMEKNQ